MIYLATKTIFVELGCRMSVEKSEVNPFSLMSFALYRAREADEEEGVYSRWRDVLRWFETIATRVAPLADQNANLDVLLRSSEGYLSSRLDRGDNFDQDTAGLQLHIHLSRLWVMGAYEFLRAIHLEIRPHSSPFAQCMRPTNSKGCGEADCVVCSIGHLKNEFAVVRMGLAKNQTANDVLNPPLTEAMRQALLRLPDVDQPPSNRFLLDGEAMSDGVMCWYKFDKRVERNRLITRRQLSDSILAWAPLETTRS